MSDVMRVMPGSELERSRLIREAIAIYTSVLPPTDPAGEKRDETPVSHAVCGDNPHSSNAVLLS
jgi:hypothetical protein